MEYNSARSAKKILCVDVCGTLYSQNTTSGFVIHHHKNSQNWLRLCFLQSISGRYNPVLYFLIVLGKIVKKDIYKYFMVFSLKGEEKKSLHASAQSFLLSLKEKEIRPVFRFVQEMRERGWCPILVSNSLDVVVEAIADNLALDMVASELSWSEGRCSGNLARDLTGCKRRNLEAFLGVSLTNLSCAIVTDNKSDSDIILVSDYIWLVARRRPRKWMSNYEKAKLFII